MTADLVAFLRERLDEDEQVARDATTFAWSKSEAPSVFVMGPDGLVAEAMAFTDARHIARHDPARVLAEVDAKRRIVAEHAPDAGDCRVCADPEFYSDDADGNRTADRSAKAFPCLTLRLLALPYAEHPDYREEWRPLP